VDRCGTCPRDARPPFEEQVVSALETLLAEQCDGLNGCHCCADEMGWDEPQKAALAALKNSDVAGA